MENLYRVVSRPAMAITSVFALVVSPVMVRPASAADVCPAAGPAVCGENSGLIPIHKDFIHASLICNLGSEEFRLSKDAGLDETRRVQA